MRTCANETPVTPILSPRTGTPMTQSRSDFQLRVRDALDNAPLGAALGRMSGLLQGRRAQAFASLPEAETIRDQARKAKLDTLRSLASQLERFEQRLIANGAEVHWADAAADANRIVIDIARRHGVRLIAKSKPMGTAEQYYNEAPGGPGRQ